MKQIILMADIINSRSKDSVKLISEFKKTVQNTNKVFKKALKSPLTITLGDEFQGIIDTIQNAVQVIFFIEEELMKNEKKFQLRFVLKQGFIDTKINPKIAYEMLGEGLTFARQNLTELKSTNYRFLISIDDKRIEAILNESFKIYQNIIDKWTPQKDYLLVTNFILYKDYKKVAQILNKDRSLIWKRQKSLNINSYFAIQNVIQLTVDSI